jgi:DHA3 family macrolide efflux protein-like MFS transporter
MTGMQDNNRIRAFFVLWSGQVVSLVGTQAVQFALIWWLAERTGSATVLATATLVGLLPITLLGPWAGAVADRRSRKAVMLLSDGAAALVSAALALAFFVGAAGPVAALAALLLRAIASAFHGPAMLAVTSSMVPARHLTRVQGLNQAVQGGMLIVSAPLGALLVAWLPMGGVLLVDVATALVAIAPLAALRIPAQARAANGAASSGSSTWEDLREGLRYVARHGGHRALLALAASINMAIVPAYSLLPLLIQGPLGGGAGTLGTAQSLFGVGTLAGGAVLGAWGGTRRRTRTALAAIAGIGIATLALGLAPAGSPAWVAGAMLAVGVFAALANGPIVAILQATVPLELQGRVFGLYGSLATLATPLGLVLAAPVAQLVGVRAWYVFGGIARAALAILGTVSRSVATLDIPVDTPAPADERGRGAA